MATLDPLELLARKLERHTALDADDRRWLLDLPHVVHPIGRGAYVVRQGDRAASFYSVLASGFAYRHKVSGDGGRQVVALHIPGKVLDLQPHFLGRADHNVQMVTVGSVARIPAEELDELLRARPAVSRAIFVRSLVELSISREWLLNIGRRDARTRVAHFLCECAARLDSIGLASARGYDVPLTQSELADVMGLTAVHLNRTLKALEAEGLICRDKSWVKIPDWQRLSAAADFHDGYLFLEGTIASDSDHGRDRHRLQ